MGDDLLSRSRDNEYVDSSAQLLLDSQHSGILTLQQTAENPLTLENGVLNEQNIGAMAVDRNKAGAVITRIEDIFESIADCIIDEGKELVIPLKGRARNKTFADKDESTKINRCPKTAARNITFPSRSAQEAWKFTALLRILELSHEALVTGTVTTKRDIYYRDPELFMRQAVVDRYVDDIAHMLGVDRDALNVVAAAKGLVAGSFSVKRKDSSVIDYSAEPEGILIPSVKDIENFELFDVRWILVIEKEVTSEAFHIDISNISEATFRTLATNQYWKDSMAEKGILITAKGYPDIQTRQFLYLLSQQHPTVPVLALVDFDPDGIGIMSTYKHGSVNLAHESSLAVPSTQWLGIRSSEVLDTESDKHGLLSLTARDRKIAIKMMGKLFAQNSNDQEWRRELQVMLTLNIKAEIQILGNAEMLGEWLDKKLLESI